jgi:hypothetical protein
MSKVQSIYSRPSPSNRVIPYDYQFRVELDGERTPRRQMIQVSTEGPFSAVSIGYSVVPALVNFTFGPPLPFSNPDSDSSSPLIDIITIGDLRDGAALAANGLPALRSGAETRDFILRAGIQLNPAVAAVALNSRALSPDITSRLFQLTGLETELQFRYALFDEATGRAFQNEPVLNTAGLGTSTGDRPFRRFSPPITFEPRSVIGLHIEPVSNFAGELFVVLHGYKVLGSVGTTTDPGLLSRRRSTRRLR